MFFFFNGTATTEIYTLSLHDALPISALGSRWAPPTGSWMIWSITFNSSKSWAVIFIARSEEHTSELQSHVNLVCRLLLEKKKKILPNYPQSIDDTAHLNQLTTHAMP